MALRLTLALNLLAKAVGAGVASANGLLLEDNVCFLLLEDDTCVLELE